MYFLVCHEFVSIIDAKQIQELDKTLRELKAKSETMEDRNAENSVKIKNLEVENKQLKVEALKGKDDVDELKKNYEKLKKNYGKLDSRVNKVYLRGHLFYLGTLNQVA